MIYSREVVKVSVYKIGGEGSLTQPCYIIPMQPELCPVQEMYEYSCFRSRALLLTNGTERPFKTINFLFI
jgi:hypothetical protein